MLHSENTTTTHATGWRGWWIGVGRTTAPSHVRVVRYCLDIAVRGRFFTMGVM